jgi:sulfonate transport system substrate-binding protein
MGARQSQGRRGAVLAGARHPAPILEVAVARQAYGIKPIDDDVVAKQQKIADTFFALGLIPKAIKIADAVRKPQS